VPAGIVTVVLWPGAAYAVSRSGKSRESRNFIRSDVS
jgi:hypothetical protein